MDARQRRGAHRLRGKIRRKWKNVLKDLQFPPFLTSRSNIYLKNKWQNLSVSNDTQGSKEKSRVPRIKAAAPAATTLVATVMPLLLLRKMLLLSSL
ncbi:Telomere repeat-binding factor [Arachis hypogaea]|nr:Telomere repeat-binding factor [Arachis hypogaea]